MLDFLASGQRTPAEYLSYLNKEGAEGCLSIEAAKLPMEWAILASQETEGKDGGSLLACKMTPVYDQDN